MTDADREDVEPGPVPLTFEIERNASTATVIVRGDLEFGTVAMLRLALVDLAQQACDAVVLDLADVDFIDSTGLSILVQAKQRFEADGRRFALRNPPPRVMRVLETSGMAELFAIERD